MGWIIGLLLFYGVIFIIVVWPIHWLWHTLTQDGRYDQRFYRQRSFWRLYAFVFGTAVITMVAVSMWRGRW